MEDKEKIIEAFAEKLDIDVETLKEVLALFFQNTPTQIETMREDLKGRDLKNIHVVSHTLKGTAANLRYNDISETASAIEILAKEGVTTAEAYEALFNKLSLLLASEKMKVCYR